MTNEKHNKLNILLDLNNITYMDSSGLWSLVEITSKAKLRFHNIILINIIFKFQRFFKDELFNTPEEAEQFQDEVGEFIVQAIKEKLASTLPNP